MAETDPTPREAATLPPGDLASWIVARIEGPTSSRQRAGLHDDIEFAIGARDHARATDSAAGGDFAALRELVSEVLAAPHVGAVRNDAWQEWRARLAALLAAAPSSATESVGKIVDWPERPSNAAIAQLFHEEYERLAPLFGYRTREESAKPWAEVPERNRNLMGATVGGVMIRLFGDAPDDDLVGGPDLDLAGQRDRVAGLVRSAHGRGVEGAPAPGPDDIDRAVALDHRAAQPTSARAALLALYVSKLSQRLGGPAVAADDLTVPETRIEEIGEAALAAAERLAAAADEDALGTVELSTALVMAHGDVGVALTNDVCDEIVRRTTRLLGQGYDRLLRAVWPPDATSPAEGEAAACGECGAGHCSPSEGCSRTCCPQCAPSAPEATGGA